MDKDFGYVVIEAIEKIPTESSVKQVFFHD